MFAQPKSYLAATVAALAFAVSMTYAADAKKGYVDTVGEAWVKAVKASDLDAIVKLYANDAVAWFPDEAEHDGIAAIRESYKALLDAFTVEDASLSNVRHLADATHRTNWGNFTLTLKQKSDGKTVPLTGRFTDVQELRNGKWVYVVDHASADPPPKTAAR